MDKFDENKLKDNQLDDVVGGKLNIGSKGDKSELLDRLKVANIVDGYIIYPCRLCGAELKELKGGFAGIRTDRQAYYHGICHECALKNPYWRDTVVDGKIVKDGKLHELYKKAKDMPRQ